MARDGLAKRTIGAQPDDSQPPPPGKLVYWVGINRRGVPHLTMAMTWFEARSDLTLLYPAEQWLWIKEAVYA